jgi:molybdopterin molybdotransferase
MPTPDEAWRKIAAHCRPLTPVLRPLDQALGHVLAEPVCADRDLPATDRSAMDGFAFRATDTARGLVVAGEVPAGVAFSGAIGPGECVRIFTGASLPTGVDTVAMIEEVTLLPDGRVQMPMISAGANVLRRGEDAAAGEILLPAGVPLNAARLAVGAAVGAAQVLVHRRPRVAVVTTGRELLPPTQRPEPHQIRDSNSTLLAAALVADDFPLAAALRASDDREAVMHQLREALAVADVVILSGGVSVGDYDFVPAAVRGVGAQVVVHKVAMKPGKPVLFAKRGDRLIFGLPGHPLATLTGLHEFVLPALRRLAGTPEEDCRPLWTVPLASALHSKGGRHRYHLAQLHWTSFGPRVEPVASHSSADLVAGGRAQGAIVVPPDVQTLEPESLVSFRPWRGLA